MTGSLHRRVERLEHVAAERDDIGRLIDELTENMTIEEMRELARMLEESIAVEEREASRNSKDGEKWHDC